jgi:hypothetical protein
MNISRFYRVVFRLSAVVAGFSILAALSHKSPKESFSLAAYGAEAVMLDRASRDYKLTDQIPWKGSPGGAQSANLFGDPSKAGLYVQLLKRPPNNWSRPHSHDNDRFITVLEGTMWIGTGSNYDIEQTVPLRKGEFVRDIAKQMHFDGSKDDGLTIEIVGMGPANSPAPERK